MRAGGGLEQTPKLSLGQAQAFESLQEILPSRLNIRGLLQELPGPLEAIRAGDFKPLDEGGADSAVPIQTSK